MFEAADRDPSVLAKGALNFVIIGGGPTGTELAGALADIINLSMTREYRDLGVKQAQEYLVDMAPRFWRPFQPKHTNMRRALFNGKACGCCWVRPSPKSDPIACGSQTARRF